MAVRPLSSHRALHLPQMITGIILIAVWWPIAWLQVRPVSDYYFFPLWLGYILTMDGIVTLRAGTSLLTRSRSQFVLLFLCSIPFWWIFEWMNGYLGNWHYQTPITYSSLRYLLLASIAFSTVVPAVLETAEFVASCHVGERIPRLPAWRLRTRGVIAFFVLGWLMLALVALIPHYAFPLAWLSLFFIVEPINVLLGQRSIAQFVARGDWPALWNIMLGTLMTGFFWEMWNYFSMPKWTYTVPFVGFAHLFEMPILGYSGYLPFGLEVFTIFAFGFGIFLRRPQHYAIVSSRLMREAQERTDETPTGDDD